MGVGHGRSSWAQIMGREAAERVLERRAQNPMDTQGS